MLCERRHTMVPIRSVLVAVALVLAMAVTALAEGGLYSLSIVYQNPSDKTENVEGVTAKIYPVAELGDYAVTWPEATASASEWDACARTLANYVLADGVEPYASAVSDATGTSRFEGLGQGLYLVVSDVLVQEEDGRTTTYTYQAAIVSLPGEENAIGTTAYPKGTFEFTEKPGPEPQPHKVTKHWVDEGYVEHRPENIKIEIYCDGGLYATEELSDANDWVHEWEDDGAAHTWTVVERDIPEGYTVTIEGMTITNTYPEEPEEPDGPENPPTTPDSPSSPSNPSTPQGPTPKTGQAWLPVPIFLVAGIVMLGLGRILWAIARRREFEKEVS